MIRKIPNDLMIQCATKVYMFGQSDQRLVTTLSRYHRHCWFGDFVFGAFMIGRFYERNVVEMCVSRGATPDPFNVPVRKSICLIVRHVISGLIPGLGDTYQLQTS